MLGGRDTVTSLAVRVPNVIDTPCALCGLYKRQRKYQKENRSLMQKQIRSNRLDP
jgi:hypothetical protein